jgi:hypothetical protein
MWANRVLSDSAVETVHVVFASSPSAAFCADRATPLAAKFSADATWNSEVPRSCGSRRAIGDPKLGLHRVSCWSSGGISAAGAVSVGVTGAGVDGWVGAAPLVQAVSAMAEKRIESDSPAVRR